MGKRANGKGNINSPIYMSLALDRRGRQHAVAVLGKSYSAMMRRLLEKYLDDYAEAQRTGQPNPCLNLFD